MSSESRLLSSSDKVFLFVALCAGFVITATALVDDNGPSVGVAKDRLIGAFDRSCASSDGNDYVKMSGLLTAITNLMDVNKNGKIEKRDDDEAHYARSLNAFLNSDAAICFGGGAGQGLTYDFAKRSIMVPPSMSDGEAAQQVVAYLQDKPVSFWTLKGPQ